MENEPLVSVLMTAYNREKYIAEAIESVINSTYQNWELIIVDDGSTDNTVAIAKSYAEKDPRIKFYQNKINLGDYPNRNKAASYAKGEYLKYLDSDDLIYPCTLAIMVDAMQKFPEGGLGMELYFHVDGNRPFPIILESNFIMQNQFLKTPFLSPGPSSSMIRSNVFREIGGFSNERYIGDTELWFKIAQKYPIVFFPPSLVFWRQHCEQEIVSEIQDLNSIALRHQLNKGFIFDPKTPLSEQDRKLAFNKLNRRLVSNLINLLFSKQGIKKANRVIKASRINWKDFLGAIFH